VTGWPSELDELFEKAVTAEYTSLTPSGRPVTAPVCPYVGESRRTLDLSTGLAYPAKADRARGNPKVCLLYADPIGRRPGDLPVALVQGVGAVRDADLQANTDRYVRESALKYPATVKGVPNLMLGRLAYYFARIWVEVTPMRILWWPDRRLDAEASVWTAPPDTPRPPSDPTPTGAASPPWRRPAVDWRPVLDYALRRLTLADLSTAGADGYPVCVPVTPGPLEGDRLEVQVGDGAPPLLPGPACLTFHSHGEVFTGQENRSLVGRLVAGPQGHRFEIERALGDWSAGRNRPQVMLSFISQGPRLAPRLKAEAARRSQRVPKVRMVQAP
jgi:hypothetical protein